MTSVLNNITMKRDCAVIEYDEGNTLLIDKKLAAALTPGGTFELTSLLKDNEEFAEKYAMKTALDYLSSAIHTAFQVRKKLSDKAIQRNCVEKTIEKLESRGFINDLTFSEFFVETAAAMGQGASLIKRKLKEKGVDQETIDKALLVYTTEDIVNNASAFIIRKNSSLKKYPPKERRDKLVRAAVSRGYATSDAISIIDRVLEEDTGDYTPYFTDKINKRIAALRNKGNSDKALRSAVLREFSAKGAPKELIEELLSEEAE